MAELAQGSDLGSHDSQLGLGLGQGLPEGFLFLQGGCAFLHPGFQIPIEGSGGLFGGAKAGNRGAGSGGGGAGRACGAGYSAVPAEA